ncbi:hmt1p [Stylonychia lemnae]|uniref:Hmt1p n=1 Tax=Stylonychia lemnae TaxID=5949 RepID=A0A078AIX1_STYLE|nr:hmt1p [Stylonychia lemnae]|eukprot:CDW81397.1 hmt1p [Stylonychia lemnae]
MVLDPNVFCSQKATTTLALIKHLLIKGEYLTKKAHKLLFSTIILLKMLVEGQEITVRLRKTGQSWIKFGEIPKRLVDDTNAGYSKSSSHEMKEEQKKSKKTDEIQEEMLDDEVRMIAYRQSIKETDKGQIVIDVEAGTRILRIFAAIAGASHVYAIEYTNIIEKARIKFPRATSLLELLQLKARLKTWTWAKLKQMLLYQSGWATSCCFDNMLPSVLSIRDRYLKEKGAMLPKRTCIYLAAINKKCQDTEKCRHAAMVDQCEQQCLLSTSHQIFNFDLEMDKLNQQGFTSTFELILLEDCLMTGFVSWLDAAMTGIIIFSICHDHPLTQWKKKY